MDSAKRLSDFEWLMEGYLRGTLTGDDIQRLLTLLEEQPALGPSLLDHLQMDSMLRDLSHAERQVIRPLQSPLRANRGSSDRPAPLWRKRSRPAGLRILALTVAVAIVTLSGLGIGVWFHQAAVREEPQLGQASGDEEATTSAVAILARTADAVWESGAKEMSCGTPLLPGWLRLKSGLASVQFFCGAHLVLEGPAELQIVSSNRAFCRSGRLSVQVPVQARGFRVSTPDVTVVDLGTAFGLDVDAHRAEVHVLDGEVLLEEQETQVGNLRQGEAVSVGRGGGMHRFPSRPEGFVSASQLDRQAAAANRRRLEQWRAASATANADPTLLVHFDFEPAKLGDGRLANVAAPTRASDGTIVGCGAAEGRWPGKGALEFRNLSDRVRLSVPGQYDSLSLAAWVRVDSLDRLYNSLFMCEGYGEGAIHWQITRQGVLKLGVKGQNQRAADYDSPVIFTPDRLGRWTHVAVTFDSTTRHITHYVDGQPVSQQDVRFVVPLRIGTADLGNWSVGAHATIYPVRCFTGRVDELVIYGRALAEHEMRKLYDRGTPQP